MGEMPGALSGVRVADFSVHAAGPFAGLMFAEMGAQVIKVESSARLDITRRTHTMYGKPPSSFEQINANKMSACLNLKEAKAVELALELVGDLLPGHRVEIVQGVRSWIHSRASELGRGR